MSEFSSVEEKISALYEIKKTIAAEMYKLCIRCNLDPDVIDYSSFSAGLYSLPLSPEVQLEKRCKQMVAIVEKIEELENV
jgi:hypothetical protein